MVVRARRARSAAPILRNHGDEPVHLEFGVLVGLLVKPGESTATSGFEFALPAPLNIVDLAPGEVHEDTASVGLARCDPAVGNRVPPGDYDLVVRVGTVVGERFSVTVPA